MAEKSETKITNACIAYIKAHGGDGFHVHGSMFQRAGEPDICAEFPLENGRWAHLKIEIKTKTGKPSKLQVIRLDRYVKSEYCSGIATSIDDLLRLIHEFRSLGNNSKSWQETKEKYGYGNNSDA